MSSNIVFLMYHELEQAGRGLCQADPGYVRYAVKASDFELQMRQLSSDGWRVVNVTEALAFPPVRSVALTFDDGSETDLLIAAPILHKLGFGATFFITTGFLNSRGYLSTSQLRDLSQTGFEIGSHSMSHPYLADLDNVALEREMLESKTRLEDILAVPVAHFSCPGGRYDHRVKSLARRFGYRTVSTSRSHANSRSTDVYELGRAVIMRDTNMHSFERICANRGLWRLRGAEIARSLAKRALGNSSYDKLRAAVLGAPPSSKQSHR